MASADRCDRCLSAMTRDTFERPLADEVLALRARVTELEGHRRQWRGVALQLHEALRLINDEYDVGAAFTISRSALDRFEASDTQHKGKP
jgi:hypothetical protein